MAFTANSTSNSGLVTSAPYLIDRGGHAHKLVSAPHDSFGLTWSPDGSRLAAIRVPDASLVIIRPGHRATFLPLRGAVDLQLVWAPDGRRIAYQRHRKIFVADADGRHEQLLASNALGTAEAGISRFSFAPDGRQLVYGGRIGGRHSLFIVPTDGSSAPVRIPLHGFAPRVLLESPAWSPDGRWIAFHSWAPAVYVVHPDGRGQRRIAKGSGAVWSPDNNRVAFIAAHGGGNGVASIDGTRHWTLPGCTCQLRGPGFWPSLSWSPDGSRIAYVSGKGLTLSSVRPDGTGATRIVQVSPSSPWQPLWRPQ
jgi:Tol biopolymer transport system component